jgi:hypothetical protein
MAGEKETSAALCLHAMALTSTMTRRRVWLTPFSVSHIHFLFDRYRAVNFGEQARQSGDRLI